MLFSSIGVLILQVLYLGDATLTPKSPKSKKHRSPGEVRLGPQNYTVFDLGLVVDPPEARDVVENHAAFYRETDRYSTEGIVLGYVTPVYNSFVLWVSSVS